MIALKKAQVMVHAIACVMEARAVQGGGIMKKTGGMRGGVKHYYAASGRAGFTNNDHSYPAMYISQMPKQYINTFIHSENIWRTECGRPDHHS